MDTFVGFLLLVQLKFVSVTVLSHLIPFCLCYDSIPSSQAQEKLIALCLRGHGCGSLGLERLALGCRYSRQGVACRAAVNVSHRDLAIGRLGASYDLPTHKAQAPRERVTDSASQPQHCEQLHGAPIR